MTEEAGGDQDADFFAHFASGIRHSQKRTHLGRRSLSITQSNLLISALI